MVLLADRGPQVLIGSQVLWEFLTTMTRTLPLRLDHAAAAAAAHSWTRLDA